MHNPLYSVAGLHKKVVLCTGKQPCLFLGNGSESWGSHLYQTGCCDGMDRIPLKRLRRQMLLWKYDFSTVHEEQEKYRWKGVLWGLLRWCPAMEYCVFCWNSRDSFLEPSEGIPVYSSCPRSNTQARDRQRHLYKPVDRFYSYLWVFVS